MAHVRLTNCRVLLRGQSARAACLMMIVGLILLPGCVRRLVYVDNQQIGTTPCSVDFTYYGTREIRLIKPGFETLTVNQPIPTPWYQIPPIDFISENLVPTKIRDNRTVTYDLAPQLEVPTQQLIDRANQLRQDTLQFPVQPAAALGTSSGVMVSPPLPSIPGAIPVTPPMTMPAPPPSNVPFSAPAMPPTGGTIVPPPQASPQQLGPPIVSPPLR
jgi:hypothetical protein